MKPRTVMLIDDEEADNFLHSLILRETGLVADVIVYQSAVEALAFLQQPEGNRVDVVFLDINMPMMDGFQFLEAYSALPEATRVKAVVVMLTTSLRPEDKARANATGLVSEYLAKPLAPEGLKRVFSSLED